MLVGVDLVVAFPTVPVTEVEGLLDAVIEDVEFGYKTGPEEERKVPDETPVPVTVGPMDGEVRVVVIVLVDLLVSVMSTSLEVEDDEVPSTGDREEEIWGDIDAVGATKHEQADEILVGELPQFETKDGRPVVAILIAWVYVAQNEETLLKDLII